MTLARAALAYAVRLGWPVFPLAPKRKEPLIARSKGGRGHHDATTDVATIRRWWGLCPTANIGIACDARSGLLALDIDPRAGGDDELDVLIAAHGALPHTPMQLTGGGGQHYLFRRPTGPRWPMRLAPGVEIKADGYIVAAPSIHPIGRAYAWELGSHPLEVPVAEVPAWLLRLGSCVRKASPATGRAAASLLARAFAFAGHRVQQIDDARTAVSCPWAGEHTVASPASSTVILAPTERYPHGFFRCLHAHCADRGPREALAALPADAVRCAAAEIASQALDDDAAERLSIETGAAP
jgi:hypothetical protein